MTLDGEKIRHKILEILDNMGRVRSTELVNAVIDSLQVSQKPVYDMLKFMSNGDHIIIKDEINRAEIWYEAKDYEKTIREWESIFEKHLEKFDELTKDWHDRAKKDSNVLHYLEHQFRLKPLLDALQAINTLYNLIQHDKVLQTSKDFKKLKQEIEKRYSEVTGRLHVLKKENALQEILNTLHWEIEHKYYNQYDNYLHPIMGHGPE